MSSNGQDHQLPEAVANEQEEDDEFGEFEGFEGGVERMQAQPAPSPWATFPDLLPVQTSPATPAEDANQPSTSRANPNPPNGREVWQGAANGWAAAQEEPRPLPQQHPMRTLNPPDVSLGTNQAGGGRVTPDNVHDLPPDAALAVVMDHLDGADARLQERLEGAEQSRLSLEQEVRSLRQRNAELEQQSQQQIDDLNARLHRNQETLEQRLSEIGQFSSFDWRQDFRQIQEEIAAIKQSQITQRTELQASRQSLEEMKTGISNRLEVLESIMQRDSVELERRLCEKFDDQCRQMRSAVESVVQRTTGNLSQLVCEAVQNSGCGDSQGNNILQSIKVELEKHKDEQKRVLEEERQRQLVTVSSALKSALKHLNSAIDSPGHKHPDQL